MTAIRGLVAFVLVASVALMAAFTGCGGSACFRNTDCDKGFDCKTGTCQLIVNPPPSDAGDAGDAGSTASNLPDAGDAGDASQIADGG